MPYQSKVMLIGRSYSRGIPQYFFCHGRDHCDNKLLHNFKCMSEYNEKQFKLKDDYTE